MNNFLFNYNGNKYLESKKFFKDYNFSEYDIICEPFCGIFGFSRFVYEKGFRGEFYLNDISKELIDNLDEMKKDISAYCDSIIEESKKYKTDKELSYCKDKSFGLMKCSQKVGQLCNLWKIDRKITNFIQKKGKFDEFFKLVTFCNMDVLDFVDSLPNNKKILIFYDPPYFDSYNRDYAQHYTQEVLNKDSTHIYIDIKNNFEKIKHDQILIVNFTSIMDYIFKEYYSDTLSGKYQNVLKRDKKHILYKNFSNK